MTLAARHSALSDIGLHRKTNEDAFVAAPPLYVVCDGMGGAQAGEVASTLAAQTLREHVARGIPLPAAAQAANAAVFAAARGDSTRAGMGTTLTAVVLEGSIGHFVHIGDSRAYVLRAGELLQVSSDHSLVADMVREGRLSEEEAMVHPHRSILSRALGTEAVAELDEFMVDLQDGDVLLLCSDGLTGPVPAEVIAQMLAVPDPGQAAELLVSEALQRGGPDNVTVIVMRLLEAGDPAADRAPVTRVMPEESTGPITRVTGTGPADDGAEEAGVDGVPGDDRPPAGDPPFGEAAGATAEMLAVRRRLGCLAGALALLAVLGVAGVVILGTVFFVSVDEDNLAVYSGLPVSVGPVPLHAVYRTSSRSYASLSEQQRKIVDERDLRSREEAMELAGELGMWP